MSTLQQTSELSNHRPTGFDYLRVILAVCIVAWHSVSIVYGDKYTASFAPIRPMILFLVPSFFALSGYLVSGSLFRTNHLPTFLTLRVIRIFPALCCEVVISALIIGAALTTLPLKDYLLHPMTREYFLNVLGNIHYFLPGVFTNNQTDSVNGQLWTIPFELECYIAIAALYLLTLHRRPRVFVILLSIATVVMTLRSFTKDFGDIDFRTSGRCIVWAFLWGVALYALRDKIKHNKYIMMACVVFAWTMFQWREGEFFAAAAIAYITVYIGLIDFRKTFILMAGDISYGIYLYGFALQQAVYQLFPSLRTWHGNFIVSLALAILFGYLSWTFIESKIMDRKNDAIKFVKSLTDSVKLRARGIFGAARR